MPAKIISGKEASGKIKQALTREVAELQKSYQLTPGLAVVIVGDNPASVTYIRNKERACARVGVYSEKHSLPADASEAALLDLVARLNQNNNIHGILVQLPLPGHIVEEKILEAISPDKDVDGFHPYNMGKLMIGEATFVPCTPQGIMYLLDETGVELEGKQAVVVGRSNIVGKPISLLLQQRNATVTMCHSRSKPLSNYTRQADVLVAAIGRPKMITADMIKEGAVLIDVGINRLDNGKLCGDLDYEGLLDKAAAITPVPGGVGPMTIAMLLSNTIKSAKLHHNIK